MSSIDKEEFEVSEQASDIRYVPGSEAEKRLVRKLDLRIVSRRASTATLSVVSEFFRRCPRYQPSGYSM